MDARVLAEIDQQGSTSRGTGMYRATMRVMISLWGMEVPDQALPKKPPD